MARALHTAHLARHGGELGEDYVAGAALARAFRECGARRTNVLQAPAQGMLPGHDTSPEAHPAMTVPATTMLTGPLGSTIHVLRADAGTIAELAAIDWNRHFPRVCLDPVRGIITLMAPSRLHEDLAGALGHVVGAAGSVLTGAARGLRSARLRGRGEPPGTGMEPDCEFYVGERARGYLAALAEGEAEADAYFEHIAPDLVVEVEITHADEGKAERYGEMGVREMWRLHGRKGTRELRVEFLALRPGSAPWRLDASGVLEGLTPDDVCEAVHEVRLGPTPTAQIEAVTRIVHRLRQAGVRVREERAPYLSPGEPADRNGPRDRSRALSSPSA